VLAELLQWLDAKLPPLEAQTQSPNYFGNLFTFYILNFNISGDIETINALMREHFELVEQAELRKGNVRSVQERAKKILAADRGGDARELEQLAEKTARLETQWARLEENIGLQDQRFTAALKKAVDLSEMMFANNIKSCTV
jgi:predicted nuclease with TOPRIM domain